MTTKPQKLELTWIGKENQPRLEPRMLIEDTERSHPPQSSLGKGGSSVGYPPLVKGGEGVSGMKITTHLFQKIISIIFLIQVVSIVYPSSSSVRSESFPSNNKGKVMFWISNAMTRLASWIPSK